MNIQEQREQITRTLPNSFDTIRSQSNSKFKIVKNPKGIKIIHEVTREEMDALMQAAKERKGGKE